MEKDYKVSCTFEGSKQRSVCVTPLLSLNTNIRDKREEAMSEKLKIVENKKGGDTTDTEISEKSKSKKRSEPSLDQLNRRSVSGLPISSSVYPKQWFAR